MEQLREGRIGTKAGFGKERADKAIDHVQLRLALHILCGEARCREHSAILAVADRMPHPPNPLAAQRHTVPFDTGDPPWRGTSKGTQSYRVLYPTRPDPLKGCTYRIIFGTFILSPL